MAISVKKIIAKVFGKPSPYRLTNMTLEFQQERKKWEQEAQDQMNRQQAGKVQRKNNSYDPH